MAFTHLLPKAPINSDPLSFVYFKLLNSLQRSRFWECFGMNYWCLNRMQNANTNKSPQLHSLQAALRVGSWGSHLYRNGEGLLLFSNLLTGPNITPTAPPLLVITCSPIPLVEASSAPRDQDNILTPRQYYTLPWVCSLSITNCASSAHHHILVHTSGRRLLPHQSSQQHPENQVGY